jgi:hypothetical protein
MKYHLVSNKPLFSQPTDATRNSSTHILSGIFVAVIFTFCTITGCNNSPSIVPVQGTVLLDGKPLEGAAVLFHPKADERPAVGTTDKRGIFHLTTRSQSDGAHVGLNKVSITKESDEPQLNDVEEGIQDFTLITPAQYASPELSGIEIDVYPGMGSITLEMTSD